MAQNVTIAGASYPDVPGIDVPKTGGGTARFLDTSDANAQAGDIAQGKTAYVKGTKLTGTSSGGGVAPMTEITWSALKALRDGGQLTPGMQYRITDYNTIVTGYYDLSLMGAQGYMHFGESAGHQFDVIVTADDDSTLNENARAALHSGDTYFANSDIAAWQLKYCLDNDATRFSFANANGKGVVYWMKDEFDNEAGYDFKNWRFVRYALKLADATEDYTPTDGGLVYDATNQPNRYGSMYHVFAALQAYMQTGSYVNPFIRRHNNKQLKTDYDLAAGANILGTIQMASIDATYKTYFNADTYYTFDYYDTTQGTHTDLSLGANAQICCRENVFPTEVDVSYSMLFQNNKVIFAANNVFEYNSVAVGAYLEEYPTNTVELSKNYFKGGTFYNTFGNFTQANTCEAWFNGNTVGNDFSSNTVGNYFSSNTVGNDFSSNTVGNYFSSNTVGSDFGSNTVGSDFGSNTVGNYFISNTVGNYNNNNEFESNMAYCEFTNLIDNCTIGEGRWNLKFKDSIRGVTIPAAQLGYDGLEIRCYSPGSSYVATIIHKTAYGQETAVSTSDGGQTWTSA